jgi:hypothetical protein
MRVRFIVSSVALLNPEIASFHRRDAKQACNYLGLTDEDATAALKTASKLQAELMSLANADRPA